MLTSPMLHPLVSPSWFPQTVLFSPIWRRVHFYSGVLRLELIVSCCVCVILFSFFFFFLKIMIIIFVSYALQGASKKLCMFTFCRAVFTVNVLKSRRKNVHWISKRSHTQMMSFTNWVGFTDLSRNALCRLPSSSLRENSRVCQWNIIKSRVCQIWFAKAT